MNLIMESQVVWTGNTGELFSWGSGQLQNTISPENATYPTAAAVNTVNWWF